MDLEMSLDEIIKKKGRIPNRGPRPGGFKGGRSIGGRRSLPFKSENNNVYKNGKLGRKLRVVGSKKVGIEGKIGNRGAGRDRKIGGKTGGGVPPPHRTGRPIIDARQKIIQNTRMKITDAREKLAELAKQTDARIKLQKLKHRKSQNEVRKQRRARPPGKVPLIVRSVNQSVLDSRVSIEDEDAETPFLPPWKEHRITKPQMTVANDVLLQRYPMPQMTLDYDFCNSYNNHAIRRTFGNSRESSSSGSLSYEIANKMALASNSRISQAMKDRLDTPTSAVPSARFMGVTAPSTIPIAQEVGHRIVVSNLHDTVTHEDIKELFEDIGPLITSHVVRPGTAEVTYVHQKDAHTAVDNYHNRQLDGQPMKCLLVNPRQQKLISNARVGGKYPSSTKSDVLPDISAIHKALFM